MKMIGLLGEALDEMIPAHAGQEKNSNIAMAAYNRLWHF
jgi:hypothetical protein